MNTTTYHRRKAEGLCPQCGQMPGQPGFVLCAACRFGEARRRSPRLTAAEWLVHEGLRASRSTPTSQRIPVPAVGHCGKWWTITALPVRCGTCGAVALEERG